MLALFDRYSCFTALPAALARRGAPTRPHPYRTGGDAAQRGARLRAGRDEPPGPAALWSERLAEAFRTEKHHQRLSRKSDPGAVGAVGAPGARDARTAWLRGSDVGVAALAAYMALEWDNPSAAFYPYLRALPAGCQMAICWPPDKLARTFVPARVRMLQTGRRRARQRVEVARQPARLPRRDER